MASLKTLNVKNLEALGAARLAELLIEISAGDAAAKRRLRLELAGTAGTAELSREIIKRLSTIAKARSFVEWNKVRPLVEDLTAQYRAIVEQVGKDDPAEALSLLWRFLALADPVLRRCDDSSGADQRRPARCRPRSWPARRQGQRGTAMHWPIAHSRPCARTIMASSTS